MTSKKELLKEKTKLVNLLDSQKNFLEIIEKRLKEVIDEMEESNAGHSKEAPAQKNGKIH